MTSSKPNILFIPLEFPIWTDACHWSYPTNFGFEEGFDALGIPYATVPAMHHPTQTLGQPGCFLERIREFCTGKHFDIVFLEVNHSHFPEALLDWLTSVAPVRVGLLPESIAVDPTEFKTNSPGTQRRMANVERNLPYLTHALGVDELDIARFKAQGQLQAMWLSNSKIPAQFVVSECPEPSSQSAIFYGALYGDRAEWLKRPDLQGLLVRPETSPEMQTPLPGMYNYLQETIKKALLESSGSLEMLEPYLQSHRKIRRDCYHLWIKALQDCSAVVNLPQYGRMLPSRVVESMAAGRPVISWEIPDRPLTRALFEDGQDILFYPREQPEMLADHIERIQKDKPFARKIARNGWEKIRSRHTTEIFMKEMLQWIENGDEPAYTQLTTSKSGRPVASEEVNDTAIVNIVADIERGLDATSQNGMNAVMNYLVPMATTFPTTRDSGLRCLYALVIIQSLIDPERISLISKLFSHFDYRGLEHDLLKRVAASTGTPLVRQDTKLEEVGPIVLQLEIPPVLSAWRVLWLLSTSVSLLNEASVDKSRATIATLSPSSSD